MARGYRRLSSGDADEIWVRLRAGHAAKPTWWAWRLARTEQASAATR